MQESPLGFSAKVENRLNDLKGFNFWPVLEVAKHNIGVFFQVDELKSIRYAYDDCYISLRNEATNELKLLQELASSRDVLVEQPQSLNTLELLYEGVKAAEPEFDKFLEFLEHETGIAVKKGPLKEENRAREKVEADYKGRVCRLVDVIRASLICESLSNLREVISKVTIPGQPWRLLKIKSTFHGDSTPGGYRDVKLLVEMPRSKFVTEIQLHVRSFYQVKSDGGGHYAYQWARSQPVSDEMDPFDLIPPEHRTESILLNMLCVADANDLQDLKVRLYHELHVKSKKKLVVANLNSSRERNGEDDPRTLHCYHVYENHLFEEGQYGEAERICRECLDTRRRILGAEHPDTLRSYHRLGTFQEMQLRFDEAEKTYRSCLEARIKILGVRHPDTLASYKKYGLFLISRYGDNFAGDILKSIALVISGDNEQKHQAALVLGKLACNDENCRKIASLGGIDALSSVLAEVSVERAVTFDSHPAKLALAKLAQTDEDYAQRIAHLAGWHPPAFAQTLVDQLGNESSDQVSRAIMELGRLAALNEGTRMAIAAAGGIPPLVRLVACGTREHREQATQALGALALNHDNQDEVVHAGGVFPLVVLAIYGSVSARPKANHVLSKLAENPKFKALIDADRSYREDCARHLSRQVRDRFRDDTTKKIISVYPLEDQSNTFCSIDDRDRVFCGAYGVNAIADALKVNTSVQKCFFSIRPDQGIGPECATAIADALKVNTTLQEISFRCRGIGRDFRPIEVPAQAITDALKVNTTLLRITLGSNWSGSEGAKAIADVLKVNTTLKELDFSSNRFDSDGAGAEAIAGALKDNTTLQTLHLSHNLIGSDGVTAIAGALKVNKTLQSLYLVNNHSGSGAAKAIADALKVNTTLQTLDLSNNEIGSDGVTAIVEALRVNKTLHSLDLQHNGIGSGHVKAIGDGVKAIADAIKDNKVNLQSLDLSRNRIRYDGLEAALIADALRFNGSIKVTYVSLTW